MARYVMLLKYHSAALRGVQKDPDVLLRLHDSIERWESKVLESFHLLGEYDHCLIIDSPDNFKAYRASLGQELSTTAETEILPAIDLPVFSRLLSQSAQTDGPHRWQIQPWARLARWAMRPYAYSRHGRRYFKPLTITGKERLKNFKGPCIVVANHSSHLDQYALFPALTERIKSNLYFGAAADRWFLKGRDQISLQPWYQSLVMGLYPVQRGGGSKALDYPRWLLDQGCNLMLFPEGTRSRGKELAKFKYGVAILALEYDIPVVPVYMTGLKRMRPPGTREIIPGPVGSHVLEPLRFAKGTSVPDATKQLFDAMNSVHQKVLEHGDEAARQS
ncbi:MAG: 1-acyl-sn-glycerol-3-phosphate acyltransferase [Pseudomonadota bacterium]